MTEHEKLNAKDVYLETRPEGTITCPHCWTHQRAEREICYRCGARFIYRDEQPEERGA